MSYPMYLEDWHLSTEKEEPDLSNSKVFKIKKGRLGLLWPREGGRFKWTDDWARKECSKLLREGFQGEIILRGEDIGHFERWVLDGNKILMIPGSIEYPPEKAVKVGEIPELEYKVLKFGER